MGVGAVAAGAVGKIAEPTDADLDIPVSEPFPEPLETPELPVAAADEDLPDTTGDTIMQPPEDEGEEDPTGGEPADWFLGIDLGATGLSAVLINQRGQQVYPLCWTVAQEGDSNRFRLPTVVQIDPQAKNGEQLGAVGAAALQTESPLLRNLKLMVKAGIPRETSGEPWMQWSDHTSIPLAALQASIVKLLGTLHAEQMSCRAVGLKNVALRRALREL